MNKPKQRQLIITMENLIIKCLKKREKCFESNSCPEWLLTILPTRIKSLDTIIDNEREREEKNKDTIDFSPYKLIKSINLLNDNKSANILNKNEIRSNIEYPNDMSFENDLFENYSQLVSTPSKQQFIYLFHKLKEFEREKTKKTLLNEKKKFKCKEDNCFNHSIVLTDFCKSHLIENDSKQILFIKCNLCQQISIKNDKNNILHFCSYIK
ncbi:unnamed protein product [Rotaria magnacalcarata]|uniref:Uncharacterized protein n=2 Tax=Rotaria magnacalcarata TaxID=392030 RepID=A0A816QC37_9BILA|nr:unnamed protein product [Rotaria magnacalcarata]CAF1568117.1 unnamed protein product [Rotaria magnacalcarata]CAF2058156.1 unnamed protein product [Rotaria magnacalcarata]CAF2074152.1 unnamed protein product [Rotaria magnacalcarata]CAF2243127.1 unnamed protein product [Rotaria magnacalcarata]